MYFEFDRLQRSAENGSIGSMKWAVANHLDTGYVEDMTVEAIKEEIAHLSEPERKQLFNWLEEMEEQAWDRQIEHDFSPGGRGAHIVERIDREIDRTIAAGNVTSLEEGLRSRREQRAKK